jgi:hypothetical protein
MMSRRSSKSMGTPCGERYCVPRMRVMPRFVAVTRMGAMSFSSALQERSHGRAAGKSRVGYRGRMNR